MSIFLRKKNKPIAIPLHLAKAESRIKKTSLILSLILCVLFFFAPEVSAKDDIEKLKEKHGMVYTMAEDILSGGTAIITNAMNGDEPYGPFMSFALGTDITSDKLRANTKLENVKSGFGSIMTLFKMVASFWIIVIAVSNMIKELSNSSDVLETILKMFTSVGISLLLVLNMDAIITKLLSVMAYLTRETALIKVSSKLFSDDKITSDGAQAFLKALTGQDTGSFIWEIQAVLYQFFPWVMSRIIYIVSIFVVLQVCLEIALRRIFLPLAISDIYQEGMRSSGARYIKKLLACILKIAAICLIGAICTALTPLFGGKGFAAAFNIIALNVTAIGMMFKVGEVTNDALGV